MNKRPLILFLIIFLSFLTFIYVTYKDYGVSWDEISLVYNGKILADHYLDPASILHHTPPTYLLFHGSIIDALFYYLQRNGTADLDINKLHLVKALIASLTLIPVFLILRKLSRNVYIPAIGTILLIFFPRWLGDIFDNQEDIVAALLYSWLIFFGLKIILSKEIKQIYIWLISFSVICALSFAHRVTLVIIPICLLPFLVLKIRRSPQKLKFISTLFLSLFVFISTLFIFSPYVHLYGLWGIYQKLFLAASTEFGSPGLALFDGKMINTTALPWYYLPKWILITTPLITLIFFALGNFVLARKVIKNKLSELNHTHLFLLLTFYLPIIAVILTRIAIYDAWRWFLFLSIPLIIISSLGLEFILNFKFNAKFNNLNFKIVPILAITLFLINIILTGKQYSLLHPYQYLYFNNLVGGLTGAYRKYETEYWGKSYKEAVFWLIKNEIKDPNRFYHIYTCDNSDMAFPFFTKNMEASEFTNIADYILCYNREDENKTIMSQGKKIYIVSREGVPLNHVIKLH